MVGQLYPEGGVRRDAGFSIFYSGINLGAFVGPFIVSPIAENFDWHWGYLICGCIMLGGAVWTRTTRHWLVGRRRDHQPQRRCGADARIQRRGWSTIGRGVLAALAFLGVVLQLRLVAVSM